MITLHGFKKHCEVVLKPKKRQTFPVSLSFFTLHQDVDHMVIIFPLGNISFPSPLIIELFSHFLMHGTRTCLTKISADEVGQAFSLVAPTQHKSEFELNHD